MCLGKGDGTFTKLGPSGLGFGSVVAADLNNDRKADLLFANNNGFASSSEGDGVQPALGNGDGTFQQPLPLTGLAPSSVAVGDFNGDGEPDLAVAVTNLFCPGRSTVPGSIVIFLGEGNGNL